MPSTTCITCNGSLKIRPCSGCHKSVCVLCATTRKRGRVINSYCASCARKKL